MGPETSRANRRTPILLEWTTKGLDRPYKDSIKKKKDGNIMFEMICEDTMPLAIDAEVDSLAKAVNREIQGTKLPDGVSFRAVVINNKSFKVVVEVSGYGNASIKFKKVEDGWMVEHPNGDIVGFDYRFIRDKGPYSSVEIEQFVLKALNFYRANYPNDQLW